LKVRVPSLEGIGDEEDARKREKRLKNVETVLQKLVGREARMWLITALASLEVPSQVQASCFLDLFSNSLRASRVSRGDEEEEEEEMQVGCSTALCMYIFGEINASNLFRGSSIGVFFFENQNTDLPL
jgi:hypothetical protein